MALGLQLGGGLAPGQRLCCAAGGLTAWRAPGLACTAAWQLAGAVAAGSAPAGTGRVSHAAGLIMRAWRPVRRQAGCCMDTGIMPSRPLYERCCRAWQARAGQCQTVKHAQHLQQDAKNSMLEPGVGCTCLMAAGAVWEKGSHLNSSRCWEDSGLGVEWGLEGGDSVEVWPAGMLSESQLSQAWARRFRVEFQRFLMELSVRPGSSLAMWAQRLPYWAWA